MTDKYYRHPNMNIEMRIITINVPTILIKFLDQLKDAGLIPSRSEALRHAAIEYTLKIYDLAQEVKKDLEDFDPEKFVRIPNGDGTHDIRELIKRLE